MTVDTGRRTAILSCSALALGIIAPAAGRAQGEAGDEMVPYGARALPELMVRLRNASRRRDFKTVPMILDHPDLWDDTALKEVIAYRGVGKQVWDSTDIGSPWLNLMRNSINAQVFSFRHPDFLAVSATHGSAHLALFDQDMWDKYKFAEMAGATSRQIRPLSARRRRRRCLTSRIRKARLAPLAIPYQPCKAGASCSWPATTQSGK